MTNVRPQTPRGRGSAPVHYRDFRDTMGSSLGVSPSDFLYVDFTGPHACFFVSASAYDFLHSLVQTPEPQRPALANMILTHPHVSLCVEFDRFDTAWIPLSALRTQEASQAAATALETHAARLSRIQTSLLARFPPRGVLRTSLEAFFSTEAALLEAHPAFGTLPDPLARPSPPRPAPATPDADMEVPPPMSPDPLAVDMLSQDSVADKVRWFGATSSATRAHVE